MPVTIDIIKQHLKTLEIGFGVSDEDPNSVGFGINTKNFVNSQGEKSILVCCDVNNEGNYLEVYCPMVEDLSKCRYKGATLAAMAEICFRTKHAQLEYDPRDGEVRIAADMPVYDSVVTAEQLLALARNVVMVMETYQPVIRHAMETGQVDMTKVWQPSEQQSG
jgi:hypothetical protein